MLLYLLFLPVVFSQVCISDFDCSSNQNCLSHGNGPKRCLSNVGDGAEPERYPFIECFVDSDCNPGNVCILSLNGDRICQVRSQGLSCTTDRDCGPGAECTLKGQERLCQVVIGKGAPKAAGIGGSCRRDSDCEQNLNCVDRNGVLSCLLVAGGITDPSISCQSSKDCPSPQECVYRASTGKLVCMWMGESPRVGGIVTPPSPVVGGNVGKAQYDQQVYPKESSAHFEELQTNREAQAEFLENIENNVTIIPTYDVMRTPATVPRQAIIDPAALPCDHDYQCRMGEACSGLLQLVDRNVTVCQYDVTKPNRTCMFHSDCLHGQRCEPAEEGKTFVCRASLAATLGNAVCVFDYECSGGEKCVNIGNATSREFRCRTPQFSDPRRNQRCFTNAECPFQQVCRHVGEVSMCVDIGSTVSTATNNEIQKKIVDFVHNLLFARA